MLTNFINQVEKNNLLVDSVSLTKNGETFQHFFSNDDPRNIRSISKVVSCLTASKAIEHGLYSLESDILPFFDLGKIYNNSNIKYLREMKIKHLLNLSIGQDKGLMFSKDTKNMPDDTDFVYYILNYDINHHPGTSFVYNNAATYLLCAITQIASGMRFPEFAQQYLFDSLGINVCDWEESKQGICLGASGLKLTNCELHKIACLILDEGVYKGRTVVNPEWIKLMKTPHYLTAFLPEYINKQGRCVNKMSYGYGLWICGNGSIEFPKTHFFCDGTDGQFIVISPKDKMALTVMSHQKDMNPLYSLLETVIDK